MSRGKSLGAGAIAGTVVGILLGLHAIAGLLWWHRRRGAKRAAAVATTGVEMIQHLGTGAEETACELGTLELGGVRDTKPLDQKQFPEAQELPSSSPAVYEMDAGQAPQELPAAVPQSDGIK